MRVHGHSIFSCMTFASCDCVLNASCIMLICNVSRYGGIHLGPDRFKHINNVARMLLQTTGLIMNQQADNNKVCTIQ